MSIIQFDFSLKLLYVALYYIFTIITREIKDGLKNIQSNNNEFNSWNNIFDSNTLNIPIMISILQLSGIIISNKRNKKKSQEENIENRNSSPLEIQKESMIERKNKITNKEIILLLIICGIFEGFRYFYSITLNKGKSDISYYICGLLLFEIMILSHFILKIHSYRHHYVSLGIMLICDILSAYKSNLNNFKGFLNKLLMNHYENGFDFLFSAFKICLEKYLMHYLYIDIFLILFYEGIVQIIFLFLFMIYYLITDTQFIKNQKLFWNGVNDYKILMIIYIIALFSLKCLELLINESFDPSYLILASGTYILYQYKNLIEYFFDKNKNVKTPLLNLITCSGYLISIIIFSELIVPNIFNFSKFTRKRIKERERTESFEIVNEILEQSLIVEKSLYY